MGLPRTERCTDYVPRPPKAATKAEGGFGKKPPAPPKKAPKSMTADESGGEPDSPALPDLPEPGTPQREALDIVRSSGDKGCTDEEMAQKAETDRATATFLRHALVRDGLLWDSGIRRRDQKGQEHVAWSTQPREDAPDDSAPLLVREDVYVSHERSTTTLHAGQTTIRISSAPGDLVEVATRPRGSDPDQEGGAQVTALLVVPGSEELFVRAHDPFITPADIMDMMGEIISPTISTLTAVRKDL